MSSNLGVKSSLRGDAPVSHQIAKTVIDGLREVTPLARSRRAT